MVLSSKPRPDSGKVAINSKAQITGFLEKTRTTKKSLMNAGIYVFNKKIASLMPRDKIFSLEKDFFPKLIKNTKCYGYVAKNRVIDIGTPARYKKAQKYLRYK